MSQNQQLFNTGLMGERLGRCYLLVEKRQKLDYHKTHMQQDKNSISVKKQDKINHAESEENF